MINIILNISENNQNENLPAHFCTVRFMSFNTVLFPTDLFFTIIIVCSDKNNATVKKENINEYEVLKKNTTKHLPRTKLKILQ